MGSRTRLAILLLTLTACTVERDPISRAQDAGVLRGDSGVLVETPDSCLDGSVVCGAGQYCDDSGACAPRPTTCARSSDCAEGDVCDCGACGPRAGACTRDADCGGGRCLAPGWCGPELSTSGTLGARCASAADCGPSGVCSGGACTTECATEADCAPSLACSASAACVERPTCTSDDHCFAGNTCANQACLRPTAGCLTDPANDTAAGAAPLADGILHGSTICGADVDWYTFELAARSGARLVVTSTGALARIEVAMTFTSTAGEEVDPIEGVARLDLPGISVIDLPGADATRRVGVSVSSADTSAEYTVSLELLPFHCAGDALDILGDDDPARLPVVRPGSFALNACRDDDDVLALDVGAGDVVRASLAFGNGADLDVTILDDRGQVLATGESTSTSTDAATVPAIAREGRLAVRVRAKRAPALGAPYTLVLQRTVAARRSTCAAPRVLALAGGTATATGTLAGAPELGGPDCERFARASSGDRLYRVDLPAGTAVVRASLRPVSASDARLALAVLAECEDDGTALACASSASEGRAAEQVLSLAGEEGARSIFLLVSSEGEAAAGYALTVTAEPGTPPANDLCAASSPLQDTGVVSVSTYTARDDARLEATTCAEEDAGAGPDRFYRLELGGGERAALELTGPPGGLLWVGTDCQALTETCTGADEIGVGQPARVTLTPKVAEQFFVAVDGPPGDFQLRTIREPELECLADADCTTPLRCDDHRCLPVPANDGCPGATITLVDGRAEVSGSTGAAGDQFRPTCATAPGGSDVAYTLSVPVGTTRLTARILEASFDPLLAVRSGACRSSTERACNDDVRYPDEILPEVSLRDPDPGEYTIIVDAFSGRGRFVLEVEAAR